MTSPALDLAIAAGLDRLRARDNVEACERREAEALARLTNEELAEYGPRLSIEYNTIKEIGDC